MFSPSGRKNLLSGESEDVVREGSESGVVFEKEGEGGEEVSQWSFELTSLLLRFLVTRLEDSQTSEIAENPPQTWVESPWQAMAVAVVVEARVTPLERAFPQ